MGELNDELELLSKPGDTIAETLDYIRMSQVELAERMGKTPSKINDIISGKESITVATALLLEKVLGIDAEFWLNREMHYREALSRIEQRPTLDSWKDWIKNQPIRELKKVGYIKTEKIGSAMAEEFLKFYGVATPSQWESIYVNHYFSTQFRKNTSYSTSLGSLAAWLRMGEIEMRKLDLVPYNKEAFKESLYEIRKLIRHQPENFASKLKEYCSNSGVALVYTICVPKAPISGAARWIGGTPLIQLTDRYKTNDQFWFTFFHEAGHILLHGKKDVFLENVEGYEASPKKESEADDFANKLLLPADIREELPTKITERDIREIARKYDTHAAIVLGRLQRMEILPYSLFSDLKFKISLEQDVNRTV